MKPTDAELEAAAVRAVDRALYWHTTGLDFGSDYGARRMLAAIYEAGVYLSADGGPQLEQMVDAIRPAVQAATCDAQPIIDAYKAAGFQFSSSARFIVTAKD